MRRGSSWRSGGGPLSPSIGEILETPTALGIRKELQSLKGPPCALNMLFQTHDVYIYLHIMDTGASGLQDAQGELCHEGSCEPWLVMNVSRIPSPVTCLWPPLAWSGKCCGNMQKAFGANVAMKACQCHQRKTLEVIFLYRPHFSPVFSSQQICVCV